MFAIFVRSKSHETKFRRWCRKYGNIKYSKEPLHPLQNVVNCHGLMHIGNPFYVFTAKQIYIYILFLWPTEATHDWAHVLRWSHAMRIMVNHTSSHENERSLWLCCRYANCVPTQSKSMYSHSINAPKRQFYSSTDSSLWELFTVLHFVCSLLRNRVSLRCWILSPSHSHAQYEHWQLWCVSVRAACHTYAVVIDFIPLFATIRTGLLRAQCTNSDSTTGDSAVSHIQFLIHCAAHRTQSMCSWTNAYSQIIRPFHWKQKIYIL